MAWVPRGLSLYTPRRSSVLMSSKLEPVISYDVATSDRISTKNTTSKRNSTSAATSTSSRIGDNILLSSIHASYVSSADYGVEISTNDFLTNAFLNNTLTNNFGHAFLNGNSLNKNYLTNTLGNALLTNNSPTNTVGHTLLSNTSALTFNSRRHYSSALPRHLVKDGEPRLKQDALDIYFAGLEAVEPNRAVEEVLSRDGDVLRVGGVDYPLSKNVYVAAFGKAVVGMVRALEDLIGDHIVDGVASVRYGIIDALKDNGLHSQIPLPKSKVALSEGSKGHFADENSNAASLKIYDLARRLQAGDILIVLLSGGGSRLLSAPCPPITIEEQNIVTRLLHRHGGTAADVNAMRRHTSLLKGGRLAQLAAPARVIGLIISDTPGDALELVGSGPTAPDPTTPRHCLDLVKAFGIQSQFPPSILDVLRHRTDELERVNLLPIQTLRSSYSAAEGYVIPSSATKVQDFSHVQNVVVANSKSLCVKAQSMAKKIGYQTMILTSKLTGIASERGMEWGRLAAYASYMLKRKGSEPDKELVKLEMSLIKNGMRKQTATELGRTAFAAFNSGQGVCIISAGSLDVEVPKGCDGVGGRSRELALSAAIELDALKKSCSSSLWYKDLEIAFLCMATDGVDGPGQDVAGVFVDDNTIQMATDQDLNPSEFLTNHDTHEFFQQLTGGAAHLLTGVTGTSVGDFQILLIKSKYNTHNSLLQQMQWDLNWNYMIEVTG